MYMYLINAYVISIQDAIASALDYLHLVVTSAYNINCKIRFEVFIHKIDGLTEDTKLESQRDVHQRVNEDLIHSGINKPNSFWALIKKLLSQEIVQISDSNNIFEDDITFENFQKNV